MRAMGSATLWVGVGATLALIAGLTVATVQWRRPAAAPPPRSGAATEARPDTAGDQVIDQALGAIGESEKARWVSEIPHLDVSDLDAGRLAIFLRHANTQHCRCGCGYTLAACRVYDTSCDKSGPRVIALLDSVRRGEITDARGLRPIPARVDSL